MITRSRIIRNAFCLSLLAVLALCVCTPVLAASNTTILTTTVPSHFDINVTIVGGGTLDINGNILSQASVVSVDRHKEVACKIIPDAGYHTSSVIYNGNDITKDAKEGVFTLHPLEGNATFSITFVANASTPNTGDNTYPHVIFYSITAIASLLGIAILLTVNRKKSTNK